MSPTQHFEPLPLFGYVNMDVFNSVKKGRLFGMQDIRIERWAHTLVHYSLYVKPGETVAIRATPLAAPLVEAVYREVLRVGAQPLPLIELENLEEILLRQGNDAQLTKV